jgi:hypothetical protein
VTPGLLTAAFEIAAAKQHLAHRVLAGIDSRNLPLSIIGNAGLVIVPVLPTEKMAARCSNCDPGCQFKVS